MKKSTWTSPPVQRWRSGVWASHLRCWRIELLKKARRILEWNDVFGDFSHKETWPESDIDMWDSLSIIILFVYLEEVKALKCSEPKLNPPMFESGPHVNSKQLGRFKEWLFPGISHRTWCFWAEFSQEKYVLPNIARLGWVALFGRFLTSFPAGSWWANAWRWPFLRTNQSAPCERTRTAVEQIPCSLRSRPF